jgi:hypothetical protein
MEEPDVEEIAETEVEEADTISNTLNFTILGTKGLSSAIKFAEWSKTMDVVVFVDEQNNLTMRRRNWQRIWSVTETRGFTSLAWKSDGKSVVTGYSDGHYTIWDIENGTSTFSTVKHGSSAYRARSSVVHVSWVHPQSKSAISRKKYADTGRTHLAPLWPLNGVDAASGVLFSSSTMEDDQLSMGKQFSVGDSSTTRLEREEPTSLDILTVAHSDGTIYLYAFGTFEIGRIEVASLLKTATPGLQFGSVGIVQTHVSSDLTRLYVVAQLRAKDDSVRFDEQGAEVGPDGTTVLLTVSMNLLKDRMSEFVAVVWQSILIQDLYYRIAALTGKMALMWSSTITPFILKMKSFQEQFASESLTLESVFLDLLATGWRSNSLDTLLIVTLGSKQAEKLLLSFESACENLEHLVNQHLRPTAERLIYRLVILESYRKYSRAFGIVGLSAPLIAQMIEAVQNMISHCGNFVLHLTRSRLLYVNFLRWLYCQTFDDDTEPPKLSIDNFLVSQFLKGDICADPIGELIRGKLTPSPSVPSGLVKAPFPGTIAASASSTSLAKGSSSLSVPSAQVTIQKSLDDSGLGLDDSLNYSYMSLEPTEEANMGFSMGASLSSATPRKPFGFKPPMTSSPENSHMGPIQLIDLPASLQIVPDPLDAVSAPKPAAFSSEASYSFSGLRNLVHQQADLLFGSISKSLSTQYKLDSYLVLFTRPELLKSDEMLTEVFSMEDLVSVMQTEHCFQFYQAVGTEPLQLAFKDAASLWTLRMATSESFAVSGVEIASIQSEASQPLEDEIFIDFKYYKDHQMLVLLKGSNGVNCQVQKLSLDSLQYYTSKIDVVNSSNGMINYFDDIVMMHPFQHTSEETVQERRDFAVDALSLSVSGPRGVGFLVCAPRKCIILDFDMDETPEEAETADAVEV